MKDYGTPMMVLMLGVLLGVAATVLTVQLKREGAPEAAVVIEQKYVAPSPKLLYFNEDYEKSVRCYTFDHSSLNCVYVPVRYAQ